MYPLLSVNTNPANSFRIGVKSKRNNEKHNKNLNNNNLLVKHVKSFSVQTRTIMDMAYHDKILIRYKK